MVVKGVRTMYHVSCFNQVKLRYWINYPLVDEAVLIKLCMIRMNCLASLQGKNYGLTATMSSEPWWGGGCCWVITYINAPTDIMTSHIIVCVPSRNHNNILECPQRRTVHAILCLCPAIQW
jgi:hypothetical protein